MHDTLTIVIPALDEAEGILAALDDLSGAAGSMVDDGVIASFEIIVVDDGSRDGTGDLVRGRAADDPRIRLQVHPVNRGVGAGLRTALAVAQGSLLLYTDADMPVDIAAVAPALEILRRPGVGVVAAMRRSYAGDQRGRAVASHAFDLISRAALGVRVRDVNFPFKLLRTETARSLDLRSDGALIDAELLALVQRSGLAVEQIPVDYRVRTAGESKTMSLRLLRQLSFELAGNAARIRRAGR